MRYADPNTDGSKIQFKAQYDNFIGGEWVAPVKGEYFDNISPVDGKVFTKVPRSSVEDIELALDAAHKAKEQWNRIIADHPLQYPVENCRSSGTKSGTAGCGRNLGQRQTDP